MSKVVLFGEQAVEKILAGVDFLADAVRITEGPRGLNAILGQRALGASPKVTRDGVTVANYTDPADPVMQLGADLVREAAQKTDNAVGDGTTASVTIAQAMIHRGFEIIKKGANPLQVERDIRFGVNSVIRHLEKAAIKIDDEKVFQVATVSAHGDREIGKLVADAVKAAGRDGVVTAEPSTTSDTYVQSVAGLELDKSNLIHTAFITHPEEMKAELSNCRILLWEGVIGSARSLVPLLNSINTNHTPLIIIAGGYEQEALAMLINNKVRLALQLIAVRFDAYGQSRKDLMNDIVALCGGKAFTEDMGVKLESVQIGDLGEARKVITDMRKTQIIEGKGKQAMLQGVVDSIRQALETAPANEQSRLKKRLAALTGGITIIKVGGITVTEMEEKKDRVVDAMSAAKAAVESGVVAGGGTALLKAEEEVCNFAAESGYGVVYAGCRSVITQIIENVGRKKDTDEIIQRLMRNSNFNYGYDAATEQFGDLVKGGIIDPVKVVIESLRNASSVACNILTMGTVVAETPKEQNIER